MSASILVVTLLCGTIDVRTSAIFNTNYESEFKYVDWNIIFSGFQDTDILDQYSYQLSSRYGSVVAVSKLKQVLTQLLHHDYHYLIVVNISDEASFNSIQELDSFLRNTILGLSVVILLSPHRQLHVLSQFIEKTHFSLATNVLLCFSNGTLLVDSDTYCIEVYVLKTMRVWKRTPKKLQCFADYFSFANYLLSQRSNFNGEEIPAAAVWTDHVIQYRNDSKNYIQFSSGTQVEEYFYLRDALNFTCVLNSLTSTKSYGCTPSIDSSSIKNIMFSNVRAKAVISDGSLTETNGTLNNVGLAESLNSGKADIAILTHQFLTARLSGPYRIQYLHPTHYTKSCLVFVQPVVHSIKNMYIAVFERKLWIALALTGLALFIAFLFNVYISKVAYLPVDYGGISDTFMWIFTVFTQNCLHPPPNLLFVRIYCLTAFLGTTIIYSVYSSSLIATFSVQRPPIKSVSDLVKADFNVDYNFCTPALLPIIPWLKGNKTVSPPRAFALQEAIPVLLSSRSAFLTSEDSFYYLFLSGYSRQQLCNFISVFPISSQNMLSATFVRHGSEFKDYFNRILLQIIERGVKRRLMLKYESETTLNCAGPSLTQRKSPIELSNASSAFVFLCFSFFISFFLFLIEYIVRII